MSDIKYIETEVIPLDCIIELKIKGEYLARLNQFITDYMSSFFNDDTHRLKVFSDIKNNINNDDPHVYHVKTILGLYAMLEAEAKAQKVTKIIKVNKETGLPINEEENLQPSQS